MTWLALPEQRNSKTDGHGPLANILRRSIPDTLSKVRQVTSIRAQAPSGRRRRARIHGDFRELASGYVEWRHGITAAKRQAHAVGEQIFVEFSGDTVPMLDGLTGEVTPPRSLLQPWERRTTPSRKPGSL